MPEYSPLLLENEGEEHLEQAQKLRDRLHQSIVALDRDRFEVKMKGRYVEQYQIRDHWNSLESRKLKNNCRPFLG